MFTPEEVKSLNEYQRSKYWHPFTCGNGCDVNLIASVEGWSCPGCEYTQDWAHDFMKDGSWRHADEKMEELIKERLARLSSPKEGAKG